MQRSCVFILSLYSLVWALFRLPAAVLGGTIPLRDEQSLEVTAPSKASSNSIARRADATVHDIICADINPPRSGYPMGLKWSASKFISMYDLCSAFGSPKGNAGCACESPGVSYDVSCYESHADKELYYDGGMFYLCQLRCVCRQYVANRPLPVYMPVPNYEGDRRNELGSGDSRARTIWQDARGKHTNLLKALKLPVTLPPPDKCAALPADKRGDCIISEEVSKVESTFLSKSSWRLRKSQPHGTCSGVSCSSFDDCSSSRLSLELDSGIEGMELELAPCHCKLDVNSGPAKGYFNLGSCFSFLSSSGGRKRGISGLDMDAHTCACNASFVSSGCCTAEKGLVWNQASLGQVSI